MKVFNLCAVLVASAALAACGGGGESDEAPAEPPAEESAAGAMESSVDQMATEVSAEAADAPSEAETAMSDITAEVSEAAQGAADALGDVAQNVAETVEDAADQVGEAVEEATGAAGGDGALLIGGLVGDAEAGRRVFARCRTCHVLEEGVNRVGPSLYGIFGRPAGTVDGFRYSPANSNSGIVWTGEVMFEYLENPRQFMPGTIMAFPGLRNPQDRADVIAYMKENGGMGG